MNPQPPPSAKRVLLLDDAWDVRTVVALAIEHWGYHCVQAECLQEAKAFIEDGQIFDVIVSDCDLPDGTGPEFVLWLRERSVQTPLALISGSITGKIAKELSGISFLAKPFCLDQLKALLTSLAAQ